jgi:ion channel
MEGRNDNVFPCVTVSDAPSVPVYLLEDSLGAVKINVDNGGREAELASRLVLRADTKNSYLAALESLLGYEEESSVSSSDQLRSLRPTRTFKLADFAYFSLLTIATVGYGDIVPNATGVRFLVCMQILCAVGVIVGVSTGRQVIVGPK